MQGVMFLVELELKPQTEGLSFCFCSEFQSEDDVSREGRREG